jgi:hypothetical protein
MPKSFYTERDIEDLAKRGVISLLEDDDVVLTDLAREKAMRLGLEIVHKYDQPPSAPQRPYITQMVSPSATNPRSEGSEKSGSLSKSTPPGVTKGSDELFESVRKEVMTRLGDGVDPQLLETIIRRVLQNVGAK